MYKSIFKLFTEAIDLPVSEMYKFYITIIIGIIAFKVAWWISPGGRLGSEIHWVARIITFFLLWTIVNYIILLLNWVINNMILSLFILLGLLLISVLFYKLIKKIRNV